MGIFKTTAIGLSSIALLSTSPVPAHAGVYGSVGYGWSSGHSYGGWGKRHRRHRHHDRVDAGDVLAGVAIIGVIAAIASSGKKKRDRTERQDDRYRNSSQQRIASEDDAANACADAAERRLGDNARVRNITDVRRSGDGYDVDGEVERRSSWRDTSGPASRFSCRIRFGAVEDVRISDDKVAYSDY
jgi:hypothetical protein